MAREIRAWPPAAQIADYLPYQRERNPLWAFDPDPMSKKNSAIHESIKISDFVELAECR